MKAIILAAGDSKRLRPFTDNMPKCLIKINGKVIIDYQIQALEDNNIKEVVVVVGYLAEQIMKHLTTKYPDIYFKFIYNPIYYETNTVYSLWLASNEMDCDFLYFNADVLMDKLIIKQLIRCKYANCLAICPCKCADEEVKVIIKDDVVVNIGKKLDSKICYGEFIGIAKFSKAFNEKFKIKLDDIVKIGNENAFFELALEELVNENASENLLGILNIHDLPYIEIDYPDDLEKAKNETCHKLNVE